MRLSISSDLIRGAMQMYAERWGTAAPVPHLTASSAETVDGRRYVILRRSLERPDVLGIYRITPSGRLDPMANGTRILSRLGLAKGVVSA